MTYRPISAADVEANLGSMIGRAIPELELYVLDDTPLTGSIGMPGNFTWVAPVWLAVI